MVTRISSSAIALVIWTSSGRHTHSAVVTRMSIAKMVRLKKRKHKIYPRIAILYFIVHTRGSTSTQTMTILNNAGDCDEEEDDVDVDYDEDDVDDDEDEDDDDDEDDVDDDEDDVDVDDDEDDVDDDEDDVDVDDDEDDDDVDDDEDDDDDDDDDDDVGDTYFYNQYRRIPRHMCMCGFHCGRAVHGKQSPGRRD